MGEREIFVDIFAAQLKRITKVPIRQERVRIGALNKSSASKALTDDLDHTENHDQYFELPEHPKKEKEKAPSNSTLQKKNNKHLTSNKAEHNYTEHDNSDHEYTTTQVIPEFIAYAKKPRIPREEVKQLEAAKKSLKHLDLFV